MSRVFIGLGSNEGDRLENISHAAKRLATTPGIRLVQMAPVHETEPIGPSQPDFLNTVIACNTTHEPEELLHILKKLEQQLGRVPSAQRWGPRPIDLDILLYDDRIMATPTLQIPHAQMHRRRFVLEPLAQLAPTLVHPVLRRSISDLLAALPAPAARAVTRVASGAP